MAWPWILGYGSFKVTECGISRHIIWLPINMTLYRFILCHSRVIWRWKYRDLEIWDRGHWRKLKMVPFESLDTVSYSHSVATMTVSSAVSTQYTNMTDTHDTQTEAIERRHRPRLRTASRGKKNITPEPAWIWQLPLYTWKWLDCSEELVRRTTQGVCSP